MANDNDRITDLGEWITLGDKTFVHKNIQQLNEEQLHRLQVLVRKTPDFWIDVTANIQNEDICALIWFFTVVGERYNQLDMGNNSPVIALNQVLKSRDYRLSKADLLWIRENSDNRFLPNGSIIL